MIIKFNWFLMLYSNTLKESILYWNDYFLTKERIMAPISITNHAIKKDVESRTTVFGKLDPWIFCM